MMTSTTMTIESTGNPFHPALRGTMPVEAPVSPSEAPKGVSYRDLPHPLEEGTKVRCVSSSWDAHIAGKVYVVDARGNTTDERGNTPPSRWSSAPRHTFEIVTDSPKFKVGDKVRAKDDAPYSVTTRGWEGVVTEVFTDAPKFTRKWGGELHTENNDVRIGSFKVCSKYFELVEETPEPEFKPWCSMSDKEKAALLLAHHEGKPIQSKFARETDWHATTNPDQPIWNPRASYRVKPEDLIRKEKAEAEIAELRSKIADLEATIH